MNKNQLNNNFSEEKYNAFKDGSFWVALTIGLVLSVQSIVSSFLTRSFDIALFPSLLFTAIWVGWIIFKKGKKKSLIVGLLIAIVGFLIIASLMTVGMLAYKGIKAKKTIDSRMEEARAKFYQEMEAEKQKQLQEDKERTRDVRAKMEEFMQAKQMIKK